MSDIEYFGGVFLLFQTESLKSKAPRLHHSNQKGTWRPQELHFKIKALDNDKYFQLKKKKLMP